MQLHEEFEWDEEKAADNLRQHGVSFVDAAETLADPDGDQWHVQIHDDRFDYNEDRWMTLAPDPAGRRRLLAIIWTERERGGRTITRIISARPATAYESRFYEQEKKI